MNWEDKTGVTCLAIAAGVFTIVCGVTGFGDLVIDVISSFLR